MGVLGHHLRAVAQVTPGRPAIWLGLRTAAATALPLALAPRLGPVAATFAPLAGFMIALADKGGAYRTRAQTMAGAALAASAALVVGSVVAGMGVLTVAVVTVGLTACALGQAWGARGVSIGNAAAIQLVVASALPLGGEHELGLRVAGYAAGAGWAMFLGLVVWPVRVYRPGRRALGGVLDGVAEHAAALARAATGEDGWRDQAVRRHRVLRERIETARATLAATRRGRRGESGRGERLLALLQCCELLVGALIGLEELIEAGGAPGAAATLASGLELEARALAELARRVLPEERQPPPAVGRWDRAAATAVLDALTPDERMIAAHALAIFARVEESRLLASELIDSLVDDSDPAPPLALPVPGERVSVLRPLLDLDSTVLRHVIRVAVGALASGSLVGALHITRGYWVTMTCYLLLQPSRAATVTRSLQRIVGTVVGAILAGTITWAVRDPVLVTAVTVVFAGLAASVVHLNYALFATLVTPAFLLLAEVHTHDVGLIQVRVADTLIGGALAFVLSYGLWPAREELRFDEAVARALAAASRYVRTVGDAIVTGMPSPSPTIAVARRAVGLALNNAELALERVLAERAPVELVEPRMALLSFTRRLVGAVSALGSMRAVVSYAPHAEALGAFATSVETRLLELAGTLRGGPAPAPRVRADGGVHEPAIRARLGRVELQLEVLADVTRRTAAGRRQAD